MTEEEREAWHTIWLRAIASAEGPDEEAEEVGIMDGGGGEVKVLVVKKECDEVEGCSVGDLCSPCAVRIRASDTSSTVRSSCVIQPHTKQRTRVNDKQESTEDGCMVAVF